VDNEINVTDLVSFLSKISGFKGLSSQEIEELIAPIISIAVFEPGQYIIQRGTIGQAVYFLYKGRVRVDVNEDTHFFVDEGELFGEMSLVTKEKRSADVISVSQVVCLTIDIETFQTVMTNHWQITKAVASLIGDRRIERLASQN
jgi:CRP-like cAMP-binding protein